MQTTTLSFSNFHQHGELFANILRARRDSFIIKRRWDLPQTQGMEFDQYDTPASRWLAVHSDTGQVLAGARLTPTTAECGIYSYMIRDAQRGLLDSIPSTLLDEIAPVEHGVWEVTRGSISQEIPDNQRLRVRLMLIALMMQAAREEGIRRMVALLPANWTRWSARAKLEVEPAGPVMEMGGVAYQAVWINCTGHLH
jgi:acyl homoserine lactone synthase